MGLDINNRKYKDSKLVYRLEFVSVNGTNNRLYLMAKGYASAKKFVFVLNGNIEFRLIYRQRILGQIKKV